VTPEAGQNLVDGHFGGVLLGGGRRQGAIIGQPLRNKAFVFPLACGGAVGAKIVVAAVEGDDGLAGGLVKTIRRDFETHT